ncbi:uncharacterized protein TrAFT101_010664 [Trichoderma asperellum]|uniref:uncharacterized protein n=1 Tax=Trichoderma asperellum TaxID=101201 RepID=UPI003319F9BF|nr:hypothetical protein TrAFT101_010664 [Trichoderma asperellum]
MLQVLSEPWKACKLPATTVPGHLLIQHTRHNEQGEGIRDDGKRLCNLGRHSLRRNEQGTGLPCDIDESMHPIVPRMPTIAFNRHIRQERKGGTSQARAAFPARRRLNKRRTALDTIAYEN